MKAYILYNKDKLPFSEGAYVAQCGFKSIDMEIIPYFLIKELEGADRSDIIVSNLTQSIIRLKKLNCYKPENTYPDELVSFLGRKIKKTKVSFINKEHEPTPYFIKPVKAKQFISRVVREERDAFGRDGGTPDFEVWCSEAVNFVSEWRAFVVYGEIIDVRPYNGDWRVYYDYRIVEDCVKAYSSAPAGVAVDFGVTDKGETILVEVNDGYAIAPYGLEGKSYAGLFSARWAELTQTEDVFMKKAGKAGIL